MIPLAVLVWTTDAAYLARIHPFDGESGGSWQD